MDDDELIKKIQSGDEREINEAAEFFHKEYRSTVFYIVMKYKVDESYVDIVLNDSVLVLIEKVKGGIFDSGRAKLKTFFTVVAHNKWYDTRKKEGFDDFNNNVEVEKETRNNVFYNSIEDSIFKKEDRMKIKQALKKLEVKCRELLVDKYLKGHSLRVIAENIVISEDAVKQRHKRCKEKLKNLFGDNPLH